MISLCQGIKGTLRGLDQRTVNDVVMIIKRGTVLLVDKLVVESRTTHRFVKRHPKEEKVEEELKSGRRNLQINEGWLGLAGNHTVANIRLYLPSGHRSHQRP